MHYTRYVRHGDPLKLTQVSPNATLAERLAFTGWTLIVRRPELGFCWEWKGRRNADGYGWTSQPGPVKNLLAHRAAYIEWVGPIPDGRVIVRHRCDNPPCINPAHLVLGADSDNSHDALDRLRVANGERAGSAKLTDAQVAEIRTRYAAGGVSQRALAAEYGVWHQHISRLTRFQKRKTPTNPRI
ncbi:HNH endonuclease [Microbacterium sp. BR1]|uniref:HNH endonuclease n=1 Tax=Microbacterium sp. BR1 TaxID=1070896 RepID=UPI003FA5CE0A